MVRIAISLIALLSLMTSAVAQTPPAPAAPPVQTAPAKSEAKKPAKPKTSAAKPAEQTAANPCSVGVIAATQDPFVVETIGLTVFGNEYAEVPVSWGLDDLVFARVRAAAGTAQIRRIAYAKGAFDAYYHPKPSLFRNEREELSNLVRQIAGNAGCERYVVVARSEGMLPGTNQPLRGLGILHRGVGPINYSLLYAYIGVTVFDGQTLKSRRGLASRWKAS